MKKDIESDMFEVKTQNTFEEYKTYIRAALTAHRASETAERKRQRKITLTLCFAACIGAMIFLIRLYNQTGESWIMSALVVMVLFTGYCMYRVINFAIMYRTYKDEKFFRNMWETSVNTLGEEYTIAFENEYFSVISHKFSANIKYDLVKKLIETQTHFYIMSGVDLNGFIVCKDNLTKDLCMFIRTHCSSEEKPQITV